MSSPRPLLLPDPDSPAALVPAAAAGDIDAFARIVRLHHAAMTRAALVVTGDMRVAAAAVAEAWTAAWDRLGDLDDPSRLSGWLNALATDEALFLVRHAQTRDLASSGPDRVPRDPDVGRVLAGLDPEDRVLLARHHLAGLDPEALARGPLRPAAVVRERLTGLSARIAGPLPPGIEPDAVLARAGERLRAHVDVPVFPVHADHAARRARAEAALERGRVVSVAICAVVGLAVALAPSLIGLVHPQ